MDFLAPLFLAVAVSVDSLVVGVTYGLRQVRFAPWSLAIVGGCTLLLVGSAVVVGKSALGLIPAPWNNAMGGIILIAVGVWQLLRAIKERSHNSGEADVEATPPPAHAPSSVPNDMEARLLTSFRIPWFGVVIQVLHDPMRADTDASQRIEAKEAVILGIALGLDAFGAGVGAAIAGFTLWIVPLIAACAVLFLVLGSRIGALRMLRQIGPIAVYLPGIILVGLGTLNILRLLP